MESRIIYVMNKNYKTLKVEESNIYERETKFVILSKIGVPQWKDQVEGKAWLQWHRPTC